MEKTHSEVERLALWCVEKARGFETRAFVGRTWHMEPELRYDREAEETCDNLYAIAKLLRTLNTETPLTSESALDQNVDQLTNRSTGTA